MSSAEIARRIGEVSERSVRYRINKLLENDVIHISAIVNPKTVGLPVTANIFIEAEPGRVLDVAQTMAEFECVNYVACSIGERDLSVQVYSRDNEELYRFVADIIGNVPGVRKTSTMMLPLVLKDIYDWQMPDACTVEDDEERKGT